MGMADEGDAIRSNRADLNLNPASRHVQSSEFEPNLALSSPTAEENHTSLDMPNDIEPTNSHASFTRDPNDLSIDGNSNQERSPTLRENPPSYTSSYDSLGPREMDDATMHPLPLCTLSPFFTPSNRYSGLGRFFSYHGSERSGFRVSDSPDISLRALESSGEKHRMRGEGIEIESSEEKKEEKSNGAANFECNICFDMAQEPVVTSCGHLFCWPCLYQWLHVHSEYRTCPVCKGEVIKSNITPIYGRGSSEPSGAEEFSECGDSNIKIPPRPRGNRFENLRPQPRPISRRLRNGRNRFEGHEAYHAAFARLTERILLPREESNTEFGLRDGTTIPLSSDSNPHFSYGVDDWRRLQGDRTISLQSSGTNPSLRDGLDDWHWFRNSVNGGFYDGNRYEGSTSSVNPTHVEQLIPSANVALDSTSDQVSVSSTMAMIQGDFGNPEGFISTQ